MPAGGLELPDGKWLSQGRRLRGAQRIEGGLRLVGEGNQLGKTSPAAASFFFKFCFTQPANNQPLRVLHGQLGRAWGTCVACHTPSRTELWEQAATPGSPVALGCQWGLEGSWEECEGGGPTGHLFA